jgi:ribosomal protein L40E
MSTREYPCQQCGQLISDLSAQLHQLRCVGPSHPVEVPIASIVSDSVTAVADANSDNDDRGVVCLRCTFGNPTGAVVCEICEARLVDEEEEPSGNSSATSTSTSSSSPSLSSSSSSFSSDGMRAPDATRREQLIGGTSSSSISSSNQVNETNIWSCLKCTLENPMTNSHCEVCGNSRPPSSLPSSSASTQAFNSSTSGMDNHRHMMMSGALLGAAAGAGMAALHGESIFDGLTSGGLLGALGGTVAENVYHLDQDRRNTRFGFSSSSSTSTSGTATATATANVNTNTNVNSNSDSNISSNNRTERNDIHRMVQEIETLINQVPGGMRMRLSRRSRTNGSSGSGSGSGSAGAFTENDINRYPVSSYLPRQNSDGAVKTVQCQVCLDDFNTGDELRTLTCMHQFHVHCIDPWLKRTATCPICKHNLSNDNNT